MLGGLRLFQNGNDGDGIVRADGDHIRVRRDQAVNDLDLLVYLIDRRPLPEDPRVGQFLGRLVHALLDGLEPRYPDQLRDDDDRILLSGGESRRRRPAYERQRCGGRLRIRLVRRRLFCLPFCSPP